MQENHLSNMVEKSNQCESNEEGDLSSNERSIKSVTPQSQPSIDRAKNEAQDQLYLIRERVLSHINMLDYLNKEYKSLDDKIIKEKHRIVSYDSRGDRKIPKG